MLRPIVVLGPKGMLGQMVVKFFSKQGYQVVPVLKRFTSEGKKSFFDSIRQHPDAVVINCIGRIKQKTDDTHELMWANAVLPLALATELLPTQFLVHPSTDCVYDGHKATPYHLNEAPDAQDDYGWSKRLGEVALLGRPNTIIPRVSIIGPDNTPNPKGLLGWFLQQPEGSELKGFTNHWWNGITTLEWCKQIEKILPKANHLHSQGSTIFQLGTPETYTKYEMLLLFAQFYSHQVKVVPFETAVSIDRRLQPDVNCQELPKQMQELINFS